MNKEEKKNYNKKYRKINQKKIKALRRTYYLKNKIKENKYSIKYKEKHRKKILSYQRKYNKMNSKKYLYSEKKRCVCGKLITNKAKKCKSCNIKELYNKNILNRKGYKHSIQTKNKISETKKILFKEGKIKNTFEKRAKHLFWNNGSSFEPYGLKFNNKLKEFIRKRDNNTCQECGYTKEQLGYNLHVHHIDFNKQNNNPNNLISLCNSCHSQTLFNRQKWIDYFQNKVLSHNKNVMEE